MEGDVGATDDQRDAAEGVGEVHAHAPAADAGAYHHAHRLMVESPCAR
jgi:hypothetical protein